MGFGGFSGSACGKQDRNPLDREGTKQVYFVSEPKFPRTTSFAKDVFGMHFSKTSREGGGLKRLSLFSIFSQNTQK